MVVNMGRKKFWDQFLIGVVGVVVGDATISRSCIQHVTIEGNVTVLWWSCFSCQLKNTPFKVKIDLGNYTQFNILVG
jgi:hypothetical protein